MGVGCVVESITTEAASGHPNALIIDIYFQHFLLPMLPRGYEVIVDRASYWECALP